MTIESSPTHREKIIYKQTLPPLLVTLAFEESAFQHFDALRKRYFPPKRNFLPAHITLFHHLPGHEQRAVAEVLEKAASRYSPFNLETTGLWMLGRGVAYHIASLDAEALRGQLAESFNEWLTPQDKTRSFKPHITIQNKVTPQEAKALFDTLNASFTPRHFQATGLKLWRYVGGPWEFVADYPFADA